MAAKSTPPDSAATWWFSTYGQRGAPHAAELPELDRLYRRYQGNSRLRFWAVDVLTNGETSQKAREFLRQAGYALPVAFGSQKLRDDLGGDGLPLLIILDKSGRIRLVHDGYDRSEPLQRELSKEIETLLHEA
jgi:hypothetical protein